MCAPTALGSAYNQVEREPTNVANPLYSQAIHGNPMVRRYGAAVGHIIGEPITVIVHRFRLILRCFGVASAGPNCPAKN